MVVVTNSGGGGGGEPAPIWLHITITRPIWKGSMPYCLLIWIATGANTSRMASESTKVPSTIITTAMINSTRVGFCDIEVTKLTAEALNSREASSQPEAPAAA